MSRTRIFTRLFPLFILALVAFAARQAPASSALSTGVVISQVYGGGGNASAPYNADFVELFNRGGSAVNITGCLSLIHI